MTATGVADRGEVLVDLLGVVGAVTNVGLIGSRRFNVFWVGGRNLACSAIDAHHARPGWIRSQIGNVLNGAASLAF
jgi:hypothetical protein